ncbi:MAG TPA: AI-2E family transporter [Rhodothermales bacterium]|nr:AI-2E family transporter [Rhodothermales bacterium]
MTTNGNGQHHAHEGFTRRVLIVAAIAAATVVLLAFLRSVISVLLLLFAAVLLAVVLNGCAKRLSRHAPISHGWSLAVVIIVIVGALGLAIWYLAPELSAQFDQLSSTLPTSFQSIEEQLSQYQWGRYLLKQTSAPNDFIGGSGDIWGQITGVFSTAVGILANTLFILIAGVYIAAEPDLYKNGIAALVPSGERDRARHVLDSVGHALWSWLLGQLVSMTCVGVLSWLGLTLLGMPLALALGLIAGILEFVPLIGPWLGAVPALLIALLQGPSQVLYVGLLYLIIQQLESNLITPIVMKKAVSLAPALTLSAAVLAGALFGIIGIFLATPLAVMVMVLVRELYVHDALQEDIGGAPS